MIPTPILRVLSTLSTSGAHFLLMGGQACVFYGATELSRDVDIAVAADPEDWGLLQRALAELEAEPIAVPAPSLDALRRGHAVHYRARRADAAGIRLDVLAVMRGVDAFETLWDRRTTVVLGDGTRCEIMALPDLVAAKKTQRDKDWPIIRRLIEADYASHSDAASPGHVAFWLSQGRTPALLLGLCSQHAAVAQRMAASRPLLAVAIAGDAEGVAAGLRAEEDAEREADRRYWVPLRAELERMRRSQRQESAS